MYILPMTSHTDREFKTCFVAMPISDMEPYTTGHFMRVYEHIIKPACISKGFKPLRADEVQITDLIVADVLTRIVQSDLMIVDLSGRNPNVLYELGIRQAFNLPTVLIKDHTTPRIFDIQGLRDVGYDEGLRIDTVTTSKLSLEAAIEATMAAYLTGEAGYNSLIKLINISPAKLPEAVEVSGDTGVLLSAIQDISFRLGFVEDSLNQSEVGNPLVFKTGTYITHPKFGKGMIYTSVGSGKQQEISAKFKNGLDKRLLSRFANLSVISRGEYDDDSLSKEIEQDGG